MIRIGTLAQDAGGMEILESMLRDKPNDIEWTVMCPRDTPARRFFERDPAARAAALCGSDGDRCQNFFARKPTIVFYNPGWTRFPQAVAPELKRRGIETVAVLDHWTDYRERFGYPSPDWVKSLPDCTGVSNSAAHELARRYNLPNVLELRNAPFMERLGRYEACARRMDDSEDVLLFLSQSVDPVLLRNRADGRFNYLGRLEPDVSRALAAIYPLSEFPRVLPPR